MAHDRVVPKEESSDGDNGTEKKHVQEDDLVKENDM